MAEEDALLALLPPEERANEIKGRGNQLFKARDLAGAIALYSEAIAVNPSDHLLFSNRSTAHLANKVSFCTSRSSVRREE